MRVSHSSIAQRPWSGAGLGYATPFTRAQRWLLVPRDRAPEATELLASAAEVAEGSADDAGEAFGGPAD